MRFLGFLTILSLTLLTSCDLLLGGVDPLDLTPPEVYSDGYYDNGNAKISWSKTRYTEGITYVIYRSPIADGEYVEIASGITGTYYSDASDLAPGETYYYKIASSIGGKVGEKSVAIAVTVSLAQPQNLRVTETSYLGVKLEWDSVPGATSYVVEIPKVSYSELEWKTLATVTDGTSYFDETAKAYTNKYRVKAQKLTEFEPIQSKPSDVVSGEAVTIPAPLNLAAVATYSDITLTWDPVEDVDSYTVQVYQYSFSSTPLETITQDETTLVYKPASDTTLYFSVYGSAGGRKSLDSSMVNARVIDPPAVAALNYTIGVDGNLTLTWEAVEGLVYKVGTRASEFGTFVALTNAYLTDASYIHTATDYTTTASYYYEVQSFAQLGASTYNQGNSSTKLEVRRFKVAPTLTVAEEGLSIRSNWSGYSTANERITASIYRSTSSGGTYTWVATVPAKNGTYLDTSAEINTGTTYYYKIKLSDGGYSTALGSAVSATTTGQVFGLTASDRNWVGEIRLSWQSLGTQPGVTYTVYAAPIATPEGTPTEVLASGLTTTTYVNSALAKAIKRKYLVKAVIGGVEQPASLTVTGETFGRAMSAPSYSSYNRTLTWTAYPGATRYIIWIYEYQSGSYVFNGRYLTLNGSSYFYGTSTTISTGFTVSGTTSLKFAISAVAGENSGDPLSTISTGGEAFLTNASLTSSIYTYY